MIAPALALVSASWVMSAQCRFFTPRQGPRLKYFDRDRIARGSRLGPARPIRSFFAASPDRHAGVAIIVRARFRVRRPEPVGGCGVSPGNAISENDFEDGSARQIV